MSTNYQKRKDDHWVDLINMNTALEKAVNYYIPLDFAQTNKYEGSLPPLLPFSQINNIPPKRPEPLSHGTGRTADDYIAKPL